MYSLHLTCQADQSDDLTLALWEAGTVGIREDEAALIAGFEDDADREELSACFAAFHPFWEREEDVDWVQVSKDAWPGREVGQRLFLVPAWSENTTPQGRLRVLHNPGMASGTGEHPCSQLALESLERHVEAGSVVADVGSGSGILALAALALGARLTIGLDINSLDTARENFLLNNRPPLLVMGSADCVAPESADIVVANISGSVLVSMADELWRIGKPGSWLILTGFPEWESTALQAMFGVGEVTELNEWRCLAMRC